MNELLDEQPFSLTVNGRPYVTLMMLPHFLKEFAYGYLVSENIAPADEIESVMIEENTISVLTKNPQKVLTPKKTVISGCGGTASYLDPKKLPKVAPRASSFTCVMPDFNSPVTKAGGFCCALLLQNGVESNVCDLGQVTALDKIIGIAQVKKIPLKDAVIAISGKVTGDMVRKCLYAGISEIIAGYPPTRLAFETAQQNGLKIVFE